MDQHGKINTLFAVILFASLLVHIVALAYVKLPDVKQIGPIKVNILMQRKKSKPKPKPEPPKPKPTEEKPKPKPKPNPKHVVKPRPKPKPPEPKPEPERPPEPLKPPEPEKAVTIAPVEPEVVDVPIGATETGVPEGLEGGVPGGTGTEPDLEEPAPAEPEPQIDFDALWREYAVKVISRIQGAKQYPARAKRQGVTGAVTVRFTVGRGGGVSGVSVTGSSGFGVLDDEAVNAVHRAAPFPPIPEVLNESSKTMSVTLKFEIR